jgi:hypothetical protein
MSLVPLAGEDSGMPVNMMREQLAEKYDVDNVDELTMDERKSVHVTCKGHEWHQRFILTLPEDIGPKSSQNESATSKGLGGDREVKRVLDESNAIIEHAWICRMISTEDPSSTEDASIRPRKKLKSDTESEMDKLRAERDQLKVQCDILKGDLVESMVAHTQTIEQFSQHSTLHS